MSRRRLIVDERGAVLIQVGVALIALIGFTALVIDYGVLWVAREQAQNAADSAALAAATTLAFDDMVDSTKAGQIAQAFADDVAVWGKPGVAETEFCFDANSENCPTPLEQVKPTDRSSFSATVSVYRNGENGSDPLPTYFARVFGVNSQGVKAQATATVVPANVATCVWPLAIPDLWNDLATTAEQNAPAPFSTLCPSQSPRCRPYTRRTFPGGVLLPEGDRDEYIPPALVGDATTTAYELSELDEPMKATGLETQIFVLEGLLGTDPLTGVWQPARRSALAAVHIGTFDFAGSLTSCNPQRLYIGDVLPLEPVKPTPAQITDAVNDLITADDASWDTGRSRIKGGCAATGGCSKSPRLVLMPIFDTDRYDQTRETLECDGKPCIRIVNFVGMFIDAASDSTQLVGHLTTYPGRNIDIDKPFVGYRWAFLRTAILTR